MLRTRSEQPAPRKRFDAALCVRELCRDEAESASTCAPRWLMRFYFSCIYDFPLRCSSLHIVVASQHVGERPREKSGRERHPFFCLYLLINSRYFSLGDFKKVLLC